VVFPYVYITVISVSVGTLLPNQPKAITVENYHSRMSSEPDGLSELVAGRLLDPIRPHPSKNKALMQIHG